MADPQEPGRRETAGNPTDLQTAQTRAQTDRGALGDKIPVEDPATAPLGTDAEASGAHPQAMVPADAKPSQGASEWPEGHRAGTVPGTTADLRALGIGIALAVVVFLLLLLVAGVF